MKLICFGDSNTYGYDPRSYLGGRYDSSNRWVDILWSETGWTVLNQGENGREIPCFSKPFPEDTDLLIIMLGTNDLLQGRSAESVAGKMEHFLLSIPLSPDKILLVAPPPLSPGEWVRSQELLDASLALSEHYSIISHRLGILYADSGKWNIDLSYDGVHFTEQGHRAFAAGLLGELDLIGIGTHGTAK